MGPVGAGRRRRDARLAARSACPEADVADAVADRAAAAWLAREAERVLSPQALRVLQAVADGQPITEIAAAEGLTVRATQSVLFRARRAMQSVWTRAAVLLGVVLGAARRSTVGAGPAVLVAATLALTQLPQLEQAPSTDQGRGVVTTSVPHVVDAKPRTPTTAPTKPGRAARTSSVATHSPTTRPGGRLPVWTQDEEHGTGPRRGIVGGALECAQNVNLDPTAGPLGC